MIKLPWFNPPIKPADLLDNDGRKKKSRLWDLLKMVGVLSLTILVSEILYKLNIGNQNSIMIYLLSVLIISRITEGYVYGVLASVFNVLIYDYLITLPRLGFSFTIGFPITLLIMLSVALITSTVTIQMKTQAKLAIEREKHATILYEINQKLLVAESIDSIIHLALEYIIDYIGKSAVFYTQSSLEKGTGIFIKVANDKDGSVFFSETELDKAKWFFKHPSEAVSNPLKELNSSVFQMPVVSQSKVLGVIGVSCYNGPLWENSLIFLRMLTSQVALAMELQIISDKQQLALLETEQEKMRANLLRAISHDLRTPLTCISGASSVILEQGGGIDGQMHDDLVLAIKEDADWMIHMIENLLSITKLHGDAMSVRKSMEAAEEVTAGAIALIRKRFPDRVIDVRVPKKLLLIPMDATLITQVLINLLENAIKNSPQDAIILLTVKKEAEYALFEVIDNGQGIDETILPNLFAMDVTDIKRVTDTSRGLGIGLSICKTIIKAHNGTIEGMNRKKNGAVFRFKLPLKEDS